VVDDAIWETVSFLPGRRLNWDPGVPHESAGVLLARFKRAALAMPLPDQRPGALAVAPITHFVPACASTCSSDGQVLLCLAGRWQRRRRSRTRLLGRFADDHIFAVTPTAAQYLVQCRPSVRAQVKPVCHLDRVGRTLPTTLGVRTGPIADDDLDAWVATEPVGEHLGGTIVEQIDRSVRLEIDEQCAVAALLSA
jgi:hypothetical protein